MHNKAGFDKGGMEQAMAKKTATQGPLPGGGYAFPTHMVPDEPTGAERKSFLKRKKINSAGTLVEQREGMKALNKVAPTFFDAVTQALALDASVPSKK
jgi:hypothetical protein